MIGSTISILLAITWGGLQFPWASGHVLAPLIIGAIGILTFFVLEMLWLKGPTVRLVSPHHRHERESSCYIGPSILLHQPYYSERVS